MVFSPDISCHDALFRPSFTFCLYISFLFLCFYRYCFVYLSVMFLVLLHYLFIFNSGFSDFFAFFQLFYTKREKEDTELDTWRMRSIRKIWRRKIRDQNILNDHQ